MGTKYANGHHILHFYTYTKLRSLTVFQITKASPLHIVVPVMDVLKNYTEAPTGIGGRSLYFQFLCAGFAVLVFSAEHV